MKIAIHILLLMFCVLATAWPALAADPATSGLKCSEAGPSQDTSGICAEPGDLVIPSLPEGSLPLLFPRPDGGYGKDVPLQSPRDTTEQPQGSTSGTVIYFFWGQGCPHCEEEKTFLDSLKSAQPSLVIRDYEVWYHRENAALMARMLRAHGVRSSGVPVTFVGGRVYAGFTAQTRGLLEEKIAECRRVACRDPAEGIGRDDQAEPLNRPLPFAPLSAPAVRVAEKDTSVTIPLLGALNTRNSSLPMLTLVIAGMDSFNPCAFFVLLSLLGLLVHAQSRRKMLLIGGIFVFFSGFVYFLFMAAWLNLFLVMGQVAVITTVAGCVSLVIAGVNIKDFFLFKQGLSLSIPERAKPKLFERMRRLLRSTSLLSIMIGTTLLALVANFYELLCTAGFPMVFTRILTLNRLSTATYYLYLVLYNMIYVVPLLIIVLGFAFTLGKRQLSEWQGRVLKLVSGAMMLGLGAVLLINPALLNSVWISFAILATALLLSLLVVAITKRRLT